jgi:hypothetical protein
MKPTMQLGDKKVEGKTNQSSGFAACMVQPESSAMYKGKSTIVTGKINAKDAGSVPKQPISGTEEAQYQVPADAPNEEAVSAKEEAEKNYREMLRLQVEEKKMAQMQEKEKHMGGVGLQIGIIGQTSGPADPTEAPKPKMTAKDIMMYNQQLASEKKFGKKSDITPSIGRKAQKVYASEPVEAQAQQAPIRTEEEQYRYAQGPTNPEAANPELREMEMAREAEALKRMEEAQMMEQIRQMEEAKYAEEKYKAEMEAKLNQQEEPQAQPPMENPKGQWEPAEMSRPASNIVIP